MSLDELQAYGLVQMDDDEIRGFLSSQSVGILALPASTAPYVIPISFGYDGDSSLYFTYLVGSESRKVELSERADAATFLVYSVDSTFNWESACLTGRLEEVPESEWETVQEVADEMWRPSALRTAELSGGIKMYEFQIEHQSGIKHTGLPPELATAADENRSD